MSLFICIILALFMPVSSSPLYIGVMVLGLSVVSAFILSEASTWFALLLFLIYVGGMLVAFAYFLALCPNQHVSLTPAFILPVGIGLIFFQDRVGYSVHKAVEVYDIYKSLNLATFLLIGVALFLAIVSVVKIVSRSAGALRPFS